MSLGGSKGKARDRTVVDAKYELFGLDLSFFTQKTKAAFDWYFKDEYTFTNKTNKTAKVLEARSGTHQIPVLITPENWCLADSTPIFRLLDSRLPLPRLYPCDPTTACIVALVEEYFDEWMARLTVHTRWYYEESAVFAASAMMSVQGVPEDHIPRMLNSKASPINWGKRVCRAVGMTSATQIKAGEEELMRIHQELDHHLASNQFILGDSPCAVDAVLLGGLRAHFLTDPWPKRKLRGLSNVARYATNANPVEHVSVAQPIDPAALPPFIEFCLREMGREQGFKAFVLGNARAVEQTAKSFTAQVYGEEVSYLTRPYVEKSRRMLRQATGNALVAHPLHLKQYSELLDRFGLSELYSPQIQKSKI